MRTAFDAVKRLSAAMGDGPGARLAATALIEADQLGLPRFGIAMLDEWSADAAPVPRMTCRQAIGSLNCSSCHSPLAVAASTLDLGAAARHFGIAAVFLRGVRGFGRLAPFAHHLADIGLVGIVGAEGPPFVAPHGGTAAVIGTNPLAIAMGQGADRVVIDIASSATTMAEIGNTRAAGAALPAGIALDGDGRPTCNAAEVAALLPRGGQIGSLLGLTVELLAGAAGAGRGDPKGRGVFILAFDPTLAGANDEWQDRLADLQRDWSAGGGYWPRGGGFTPEAVLDADFVQRLEVHLARMTTGEGR